MITHHADRQCFESENGGVLEYRFEGSVVVIDHTEVPPQLRGQGVAGQLAQAALTHAQSAGWRIRPQCRYIATYIERHPQFKALLA